MRKNPLSNKMVKKKQMILRLLKLKFNVAKNDDDLQLLCTLRGLNKVVIASMQAPKATVGVTAFDMS